MVFTLLFLGLLPLVFLVDVFQDSDNDASDDATAESDSVSQNVLAPDPIADPLLPGNDDDAPFMGDPVDPDTILQPETGDDEPFVANSVDPDTILDPTDTPAEEFPIVGDGSLLQQLLASETDFDIGSGYLGARGGATSETVLTGGDDVFSSPADGTGSTAEGTLDDWDGTPVLSADSPINVIDGGAGDDEISLGDAAAFAFGGAGNDTLCAGDGAAALFGGAGDDRLTGSDSSPAWLDGGIGNDILLGGLAGEVIHGGAHTAEGATAQDNDVIDGGGGNDVISGGYGADILSGGDGDDMIDHLGRVEQEVVWERHDFGWHIDNEADTLAGGTGNDTLIMDRADSAEGGEGNDTFWVYFDSNSGSGAADIGDFHPGEDFLRVTLNPEIVKSDPVVEVLPSEDGQDGLVMVNGDVVAVLRGAPEATVADVYVEVVDNVFGG